MAGTRKFKQLPAQSMIRPACGAMCAIALLLQAEVCLAQTDMPVELSWEAPENCPQQPEVQEQIRALVGTLGETQQSNLLRVRGVIEPFNERYRLTLLIERNTTHGTRMIESEDCQSLGKAAAVVLGLLVRRAINSGRELTESDISGQPEQPPKLPDTRRPQTLATTVAPSTAEHERPWRVLIRGPNVSVDFWTLPRPSYGTSLGFGIAHDAWRAFVTGGLWLSQTKSLSGGQPYQADFRRWSFETWVCRGTKLNPFEIAPCALLALDDVTAQASGGGRVPTAQNIAWLSVGGGISGYLHIHRNISFVASVSGRIMTNRPQFLVESISGDDQAHKVPLGTFVSSLGCEWIF